MTERHAGFVLPALLALAACVVTCAGSRRQGPVPAAPGGIESRSVAPAVAAPGVIRAAAPMLAVSLEGFDVELDDEVTMKHWIEERLATFKPPRSWPDGTAMPSPEARAFGDSLLEKLREPAAAAVQVAMGPDQHPSVRENAWQLLAELEEMAIPPLAEARFPDAGDRVRAATIAVDAELALRARIAASIAPMLADRSLPVYPPEKPVEQMSSVELELHFAGAAIRTERFCDTAFWLMRALHHPGEERAARKKAENAYFQLPRDEWDRFIEEARVSGVYNRAVDPKARKP